MSIGSIVTIVLQLIFLEGILSIDNAAVLGAMVVHLPSDAPIPWPEPLAHWHHTMHDFFGHQRQAALKVGLLGAYVGRTIMLFFASLIIANPWLRLLGALYLIKLTADHFGALAEASMRQKAMPVAEEDTPVKTRGKKFWSVVVAVELADLAFSLDNVVAAVALSNEFWVVVLGVALGILVMRFAAGIFSFVVEKEPILVHAAYLLILNIGIELIIEDFIHMPVGDITKFTVSLVTLLVVWLYGRWRFLHFIDPLLLPIGRLLGLLDFVLNWLFYPATWLVGRVSIRLRSVFSLVKSGEMS